MFTLDKHLGEYTLSEILFGKFFELNRGCLKRIGVNEVLTNESLALENAWHSCMIDSWIYI